MTEKIPTIEEKGSRSVYETDSTVSYLGVTLEKAKNNNGSLVPKKEKYSSYVNDEFSLELQKILAISFQNGDPILIEGGTSLGKTTTVKKMCADLGWEVHYANLNGATDVEDLMGRYIPNIHKKTDKDPEFVFSDGKITTGLRQEEGKKKVIILDEFNATSPNILIRLHEVIDALERDDIVVLSEDASETIPTSKEKTKIVALTNPPGGGYIGRSPLDPAQLRRWVYQKLPDQLPSKSFSNYINFLSGAKTGMENLPLQNFLFSSDKYLKMEQLKEIEGLPDLLVKYQEFHRAAQLMIGNRDIAADQPQKFTFDDRMEPARVINFIRRFYDGHINQTFQEALRYYYINKLSSQEDKQKLEEILRFVQYKKPTGDSRRRTVGGGEFADSIDAMDEQLIREAKYNVEENGWFIVKFVQGKNPSSGLLQWEADGRGHGVRVKYVLDRSFRSASVDPNKEYICSPGRTLVNNGSLVVQTSFIEMEKPSNWDEVKIDSEEMLKEKIDGLKGKFNSSVTVEDKW